MVDFYTEINAVADELIDEFGRPVVFRKKGVTSVTNPDRPWETTRGDPGTTNVNMVFTRFRREDTDGTVIQVGDAIAIVSSVPLGTVEPDTGDSIIDGDTTWRVMDLVDVRPGPVQIVYRLHVRPGATTS